jgi:hypothetical protein
VKIKIFLLSAVVTVFSFLTSVWAENWKVVWKDSTQELKVDRDSVRINGSQVEYWYSDTVDALVDLMEHRYYAVSDCASHQMKLVEVYDPASGQTNPVKESEWKDRPYNPDDPVTVMHYEVCLDYGGGG